MSQAESTGAARPGDASPAHRYAAALANLIEARWQDRWEQEGVYRAPNPGEPGFERAGTAPEKRYILDMFPYPSGAGLHVGHPLGYISTDIFARFQRMLGRNVLHAMGYDAFGLPAEQYAVQTGQHPRVTTERNIANMRAQLRRLGLGHDDRRSVATTDLSFYRWTQWIFLQIYNAWFDEEAKKARPIDELVDEFESERRAPFCKENPEGRAWSDLDEITRRRVVDSYRLAYLSDQPVNWCPALGTVLANEEVTSEGRSERGNHPVYQRPLRQWMMRITAYAERLLDDLEPLDWPEAIKLMQRNWIGRSVGARVRFPIDVAGVDEQIEVFTTRPDTLFGATYMVLSPEHPLVDRILPDAWPDAAHERARFEGAGDSVSPREAVDAYRAHAAGRTDVDRQIEAREKTGVFTGAWATNPATRERIPIFIADYVLMAYGTGAIMAVPAHDARDYEFARQFDLPIRDVVYPPTMHAAAWFVRSVDDPDDFPMGWELAMADFLGVLTSESMGPDQYEEALERVRTKRSAPSGGDDEQIPTPEIAGASGGRRGAVQQVWIESLSDLVGRGWTDLKRLFSEGAYLAAAGEAYEEPGLCVNSANEDVSLDALHTAKAKTVICEWLERAGCGAKAINYKLRDWLFSRQRYWGEPFPIVFDEHDLPVALPESILPVVLPEMEDFAPTVSDERAAAAPEPPLGRAADWRSVRLDLGDGEKDYRRELNTMPQWAGSCWYYLRYLDPENEDRFCAPQVERYWMLTRRDGGASVPDETFDPNAHRHGGVDLYVGGVEHAVLHLLYARFWHKILFDLGHVSTPEPFHRLFNQGYIQAYAFTDERGLYVPADEVVEDPPGSERFFHEGRPVSREYGKMGKSLKNVVTPDEICRDYGADTLRLYEMYLGPLEASKPWSTRDIIGVHRFLQRVWRNFIDEHTGEALVSEDQAAEETRRLLHRTIDGVRTDMANLSFNTAIAKLIEFNNHLTQARGGDGAESPRQPREIAETFALMLSPLAPHIAEELWERLGHERTIVYEPFPEADPSLLIEESIELPVQVGGKVRTRITVPADASEERIEQAALADEQVKKWTDGKTIRKVIVVPGKMVNIVAT